MEDSERDLTYLMAKLKAEKLRRFYMHSIVFLIVNIIIIIIKVTVSINNGNSINEAFLEFNTYTSVIIWGLVLAIHAFSVFGPNVILSSKWEEKKLRRFIKEEEEQINNQ